MKSLRDKEKAVESAFQEQWKKDHPKKEAKINDDPVLVGSPYAWLKDIYDGYVIYEDEGDLFKLEYSGGFDNPSFKSTKNGVKVEMKPVEVGKENMEKEKKDFAIKNSGKGF